MKTLLPNQTVCLESQTGMEGGEERRKMVNTMAVAFPKRSKLSLIDADAWQTRVYSIARALTEAADRG